MKLSHPDPGARRVRRAAIGLALMVVLGPAANIAAANTGTTIHTCTQGSLIVEWNNAPTAPLLAASSWYGNLSLNCLASNPTPAHLFDSLNSPQLWEGTYSGLTNCYAGTFSASNVSIGNPADSGDPSYADVTVRQAGTSSAAGVMSLSNIHDADGGSVPGTQTIAVGGSCGPFSPVIINLAPTTLILPT
jgi:hypothetical protein